MGELKAHAKQFNNSLYRICIWNECLPMFQTLRARQEKRSTSASATISREKQDDVFLSVVLFSPVVVLSKSLRKVLNGDAAPSQDAVNKLREWEQEHAVYFCGYNNSGSCKTSFECLTKHSSSALPSISSRDRTLSGTERIAVRASLLIRTLHQRAVPSLKSTH